jgi:mannose-6-phosphate isomerase-like protein (cupin superfamily)
MATEPLEHIIYELEPIALIIRSDYDKPGVHFFTPSSFPQQVAFMRHEKGKKIDPHVHNLVQRQILYTQEVLFIRQGQVKVNLYSTNRRYICSRVLAAGDIILLCGGGHSFEMLEDSAMLEVKQGPYVGEGDKTRFEEAPECR